MDVRKEIKKSSAKEDKKVLLWLFDNYHMSSQWYFVATCSFKRYGVLSYETTRIWYPTKEGRLLFKHKEELNEKNS